MWNKRIRVAFSEGNPSERDLAVEERVLSLQEVSDKRVVLQRTPFDANNVIVDILNGSTQKQFLDFVVVGNLVAWNGKGLDGLVSVGDTLRIVYEV